MFFRPSNTNPTPGQGSTVQRGYPTPGSGSQTTGRARPQGRETALQPVHPTKGRRTFFRPAQGSGAQRGFPTPLSAAQLRPKGSMPNIPMISGLPDPKYTPYYSRGTAAFVQNYGKVLYNPIGAGVYAPYRSQAYYGQPGQYINQAIWWTNQIVPTNVPLIGLNNPDVMAALLGSTYVEAVVRVGG